MSGHNKWSKIKHKKAATDAQKSKIFSKVVRLITLEAKTANGDINSPSLKAAIEKARSVNMPQANIDRAVKKGVSGDSAALDSVLYEAYGPGGSAVIIEGLTDNRNRTAAEIKHTLSKNNTQLAGAGAATWAFDKVDGGWKPKTTLELGDKEKEQLERLIEKLDENDDVQEVYTNTT